VSRGTKSFPSTLLSKSKSSEENPMNLHPRQTQCLLPKKQKYKPPAEEEGAEYLLVQVFPSDAKPGPAARGGEGTPPQLSFF
jgi:hypothetical protein